MAKKMTKPGHDPKTHRIVTVTEVPTPEQASRTVMVERVPTPEQASRTVTVERVPTPEQAGTPKQAPTKKAPTPTSVKTLALRVNDEYAAWIEELRALNRTTQAGLFDQALAEFAEKKGFRRPPARLT